MLEYALLDNLKIKPTSKMRRGAPDLLLSAVRVQRHGETMLGGGEGEASLVEERADQGSRRARQWDIGRSRLCLRSDLLTLAHRRIPFPIIQ